MVAGGAMAAGAAAVAPPAAAVTTYAPRPYRATAIPSASTLNLLRRFTSGYTPALNAQVNAAGGAAKWFERQLSDGYDDNWYRATSAWWPSINATPDEIWQRDQAGTESLWWADTNYQSWAVVRRYGTRRQVLETMAEFWEHHFNIPADGEVGPFRTAYGKTIRAHALGRFADLLPAAVLHPAMAVYLNNANSSKDAPNENLGRELLELHTVGVGSYGEDDVKDSARILTGFVMDEWDTWTYRYDPSQHATGPVAIMGFRHANADPDGQAALAAYLTYLARHRRTAQHLALKLATRFVSDTPPASLVARLASVYLASDTAIKPVLRALVSSTEFKASAGRKVRTPSEDVIATWRALGAGIDGTLASSNEDAAVNQMAWQCQQLGMLPFGWGQPNGRPDDGVSWSSTARYLGSLELHYTMAGSWWPTVGATYRRQLGWLPERRLRFDLFVDHLARVIHGRGSTPLLLQVACEATGCRPGDVISAQHPLFAWQDLPRLLTVFLDCPTHMTR
ncbi:hypothetical protein GCM10028772_08680 [Nocardioides ultimimeridianus]